jgi:hypothetical protein
MMREDRAFGECDGACRGVTRASEVRSCEGGKPVGNNFRRFIGEE